MERTDKQFWATVISIGAFLALCAIVLHSMTGCTTQRKANAWYAKHEMKRAEMCHILYPCQDSVHEVYKFVEGETKYVHGDTIYTMERDTVKETITKRIVRVDTAFKDKVVYQTDKAENVALQAKYSTILLALDQSRAQTSTAQESAKKWRNRTLEIGVLLILIVVAFIVGKTSKFI